MKITKRDDGEYFGTAKVVDVNKPAGCSIPESVACCKKCGSVLLFNGECPNAAMHSTLSKQPVAAPKKARGNPDRTKYGKRHIPGEMNQTESRYAELLEARKLRSEIISWDFESITLKLADGCRYTPDFAVWNADGTIELVDVKGAGPVDPKSRVKIKVAAERFPQFCFVMAQERPKKAGFEREEF